MLSRMVLAVVFLAVSITVSSGWSQDNSLQTAANQAAIERLAKTLVTDMDELIPGEYAADSESRKILVDIARAYIERQQSVVETRINDLRAVDPNVPPTELLLAGLAFATNNPSAGSVLLERGAIQYRQHPGFPLAFSRLALLQNRFYDSVALNEKAIAVNQTSTMDARLKKHYRTESVALMAVIEIRRNELANAEKFAREWEQLAPQDDKMLLASAEIRFKQQKLESAVAFLQQRSAAKQAEVPTEVVIGKWYQVQGDNNNYSKWIGDAYQKAPQNKLIQIEYAAVLLRQEKFDETLKVISDFEKTHGETFDSRLIKGRIAFSNQNYRQSSSILADLFRQQPNHFESAYLYVLSLLENPDDAIKKQAVVVAQRTYQRFPNNQLALAAMGWALLNTGSIEAGGELIQKAATSTRLLPDTAYFLAEFMSSQNRNAQAKRILEPTLASTDVFLFRARAQALLEKIRSQDNLPNPGN